MLTPLFSFVAIVVWLGSLVGLYFIADKCPTPGLDLSPQPILDLLRVLGL